MLLAWYSYFALSISLLKGTIYFYILYLHIHTLIFTLKQNTTLRSTNYMVSWIIDNLNQLTTLLGEATTKITRFPKTSLLWITEASLAKTSNGWTDRTANVGNSRNGWFGVDLWGRIPMGGAGSYMSFLVGLACVLFIFLVVWGGVEWVFWWGCNHF